MRLKSPAPPAWLGDDRESGPYPEACPYDLLYRRIMTCTSLTLAASPTIPNPTGYEGPRVMRGAGRRMIVRAKEAFTLVEVALCLAIIGFAIVAIIGVMPLGMTVQKDNRSDTIINQDGMYWLNAIRTGAIGTNDTPSFVHWVEPEQGTRLSNSVQNPLQTDVLIGMLSTPTVTNGHRARVRAISSSAAERETEIGFDYLLYAQIQPFTNTMPANATVYSNLMANMYEVRLILRYPAMPDDSPGSGKKVFRSLVTGRLEEFAPGLHRFNSQILEVAP